MSQKVALFISHASADVAVTKAFVNLIESGIGVPPGKIFCTSNKGQGIRPGAEFKESIRDNLDGATTVIALISENYYNSPFSMCELGGAWVQSKDFIPILIPPIRFSDMKAVLLGLQAIRIEIDEDLDELRDEIAERLAIKPLSTPRWNEKRDEFLESLPEQLKKMPLSPVVQRELLEKAENVIREYEEELSLIQGENKKLKNSVSKLMKAKNAKEVSKIMRESMDEVSIFYDLIKNTKSKLNKLDNSTIEAIFTESRGGYYCPGGESSYHSWGDMKKALDYKEVEINSDENAVYVNNSHPKVSKALDAISELDVWLKDASAEFIEWYNGEYDGYEPDLSDRTFWDSHLF